MEKKEFKVGEVFAAGLVRLKCVEGDTCDRRIFEKIQLLFIYRHDYWSM